MPGILVAALLLCGCTASYAPRVIDGYPLGVQICMDFGTCFDEPAREAWRWLDKVDPGHVHMEIEGYLADYRDAAGTTTYSATAPQVRSSCSPIPTVASGRLELSATARPAIP